MYILYIIHNVLPMLIPLIPIVMFNAIIINKELCQLMNSINSTIKMESKEWIIDKVMFMVRKLNIISKNVTPANLN